MIFLKSRSLSPLKSKKKWLKITNTFLDLVPFLLDLDTFHGPYYNSFGDLDAFQSPETLMLSNILRSSGFST